MRVGSLLNGIMDSMNAYTRMCAVKYGYLYVDISDVETPASVTTMSIGHILSLSDPVEYALTAHPTPNGYTQIAERIIAAVEKNLTGGTTALDQIRGVFTTIIDWLRVLFFRAVVSIGSLGK